MENMESLKNKIKNCCIEKEDLFCTSHCPFDLDVREFVSRVQRGGFNLAYRLYSNTVGFPFIVSELCKAPCKDCCPRSQTDSSIAIDLLEKASLLIKCENWYSINHTHYSFCGLMFRSSIKKDYNAIRSYALSRKFRSKEGIMACL